MKEFTKEKYSQVQKPNSLKKSAYYKMGQTSYLTHFFMAKSAFPNKNSRKPKPNWF
ncbi:hypothetical protein [Anaerotignum lactatifermentans]|uniref:hypothetical protein n=1 Tax=Anaerotignum lactatifermentans TaxID=160404 RepID=UPI003AB1105B